MAHGVVEHLNWVIMHIANQLTGLKE